MTAKTRETFIPATIKEHLDNAKYFLDAARALPSPAFIAAHILMLLAAQENFHIAGAEFESWVGNKPVSKKLYRSHKYKLNKSYPIEGKIVEHGAVVKTSYKTGEELARLRLVCQYGVSTDNRSVRSLFKSGWNYGRFERDLRSKIRLLKTIFVYFDHERLLEEKSSRRKEAMERQFARARAYLQRHKHVD